MNVSRKIFQFNLSYSTSLFPPNLTQIFRPTPPICAAAVYRKSENERDESHDAKPTKTKTKKARTMARLINSAAAWSARLESLLCTATPLSQTTLLQTLRRIKTPSKALRFFNWAHGSGFTHTHHSYFIMLEILGRARNLNTALNFLISVPKKSNHGVQLTDKFFNSLIRSYGDAGLFQESLKVFKLMKAMGIPPSAVTFNCLFLILLKCGRMRTVLNLYPEMLSTYGVRPDLYTFNILIRGFCRNLMIDEAFRIFKEMEKFDCTPDLLTYNTIVDGLCRAGNVNMARKVVDGMQKKGENLRPNVISYTTLIRGYCGKGEIGEAVDVFRKMVDRGIRPNEITYNTFIQGLCESQSFDMVKEILGKCDGGDGRLVPDTCTFNTVMNAHCNGGNLDEALRVFEKMTELNVKQDSATYSMLIRALCKRGNFEMAEKLLDELFAKDILLREDGCTPLAAAYNPIFRNLCANGKTKKAERVFRQLIKRGIQDPPAYKTLILGHCKEGTGEDGHQLLVLMLRRSFVPDAEIYESLIEVLLSKGEPNLAYDTLEKMSKSSHLPRTSTFHRVLMELVKKEFSHESACLIMLMLDKQIRPNINLSTDAIEVIFRSGSQKKAFQLVRILYKNGYIVHMEELIVSLCKDRKFMEASELLVFSLKNDQTVDIVICNTILTGLSRVHRLSEAFNLYYELLEKGIEQPSSCLEELRIGLEAEGKLREAEFIAKRLLN
ncbi:pentatricopeptide repeat-containing protein At1g02060, chloroplastic [Henckelia pumila]|uniref:pentatricopeptide repeat-containing protein At1g02060, chloroplastic n=1 Tax=Henckelia pumila TaxID=405737 RepID=UPI003C6E788C